jgi:hypothetical protein
MTLIKVCFISLPLKIIYGHSWTDEKKERNIQAPFKHVLFSFLSPPGGSILNNSALFSPSPAAQRMAEKTLCDTINSVGRPVLGSLIFYGSRLNFWYPGGKNSRWGHSKMVRRSNCIMIGD